MCDEHLSDLAGFAADVDSIPLEVRPAAPVNRMPNIDLVHSSYSIMQIVMRISMCQVYACMPNARLSLRHRN